MARGEKLPSTDNTSREWVRNISFSAFKEGLLGIDLFNLSARIHVVPQLQNKGPVCGNYTGPFLD